MSTPPEFKGFHTRAVHAGARPDPSSGSRAMPIHQTTSYVFEDSESAAAYFNLQEYGNTYSRIMNPTVAALEERVANLEGGVGAVAFASGLAAQSAALFTMLEPGDHVVASAALYGGSITQFKHVLRKLSVALDFVDPEDLGAWRSAMTSRTKLLFGETIGNPSSTVLDIESLANVAHDAGVPLMVDNTFATPYLCRPLEWGADIVVHSATKFLGGHGTSIGGVVVESGEFDWSNGRFPVISEPSPAYHGLKFHETFGTFGYLMKLRAETLRDLGACMSPFNAFLIAQGIETLPLRMRQHVSNAETVARHLRDHPRRRGCPLRGARPGHARQVGGKVSARWRGRGVLFRSARRPLGRRALHRAPEPVQSPGQCRRRQEPGDSSGDDHPPPAQRCRAHRGRHRSRHDSDIHRDRRCRGSHRRSRLRTGELLRSPMESSLERWQDPAVIQRALQCRRIAVVGLSANELRASHFVGYYLHRHGYDVVPVNPRETTIFGRECYPSLADVPGDIDLVDVFRDPGAVPEIAAQAVARNVRYLWLQFGVISSEGVGIAEAGSVQCIVDRCIKIEHARYLGRMHWLGFNTDRISARRRST